MGVKQNAENFHHHVKELRRRLVWVVLAVGISGALGYVFRAPVIKLLQNPLGAPLFYTSPAGSFNFIMKVSTIIGVFIALPVIVFQLLKFIEPALPKKIGNSSLLGLILTSFMLALSGIAFGFFVMIPISLKFFAGYSNAQIQPLISAEEYLNFVLNTLIFFALVFQLPLITLFGNTIKPTKPRKLLKYQKHVVVGSLAVALILPFTYDPVSQFVMAMPIIVLFYISVAVLWVVDRRASKKLKKMVRKQDAKAQKPQVVAEPAPESTLKSPEPAPQPMMQKVSPVDGFVFNSKKDEEEAIRLHLEKRKAEKVERQKRIVEELKHSRSGKSSIDGLGPVMRTA